MVCIPSPRLFLHIGVMICGSAALIASDEKRGLVLLSSSPFAKDSGLEDVIQNYLAEQSKIDENVRTEILADLRPKSFTEKWDFRPYKYPKHRPQHKNKLRKRRRKHLGKQAESQVETLGSHAITDTCFTNDCWEESKSHLDSRAALKSFNIGNPDSNNMPLTRASKWGISAVRDSVRNPSTKSEDVLTEKSLQNHRHQRKSKHRHHLSYPSHGGSNAVLVERGVMPPIPPGLPPDIVAKIKKMRQKAMKKMGHAKSGPPIPLSKKIGSMLTGGQIKPPKLPVGMAGGARPNMPRLPGMPSGAAPGGPSGFPPGAPPGLPPGVLSGGSPHMPPKLPPGIPPGPPPGFPHGLPSGFPPGLPPGFPPGLPPGFPPALPPGFPPVIPPGLPPGLHLGLPPGLPPGIPSLGGPGGGGAGVGIAPGLPPHLPSGMSSLSGGKVWSLPKPIGDYTWLKESLKALVDGEAVKAALQKDVLLSAIPEKMFGAVKPQRAVGFSVQYTSRGCSEIATFKAMFPNQAASACMVCQAGGSMNIAGGGPNFSIHGGPAHMPNMPLGMPPGLPSGMSPGGSGSIGSLPASVQAIINKASKGHHFSGKKPFFGVQGKAPGIPKGIPRLPKKGIPGMPPGIGFPGGSPSGMPPAGIQGPSHGAPGPPPGIPGPPPGIAGLPPRFSGLPHGAQGKVPGIPQGVPRLPKKGIPGMPPGIGFQPSGMPPAGIQGPSHGAPGPPPGIPGPLPGISGLPPRFPGLSHGARIPGPPPGMPGPPPSAHHLPFGSPPVRRRRGGFGHHHRYRRWVDTQIPWLSPILHHTLRVHRAAASGRCVPICEIRDVKAKCTVEGTERRMALTVVGTAVVPPAKNFKKCSKKCEQKWELLLQYAAVEKLRAYFASGDPIAAGQPANTPVPSSWQVEKVLRCSSLDLTLEAGLCYPQGNWILRAIIVAQKSEALVAGLGGGAVLLTAVVIGLLVYFKVLSVPKFCKNVCKGFKLGGGPKKAGESDTLGEGGAGTVEFSEEPPPPPP